MRRKQVVRKRLTRTWVRILVGAIITLICLIIWGINIATSPLVNAQTKAELLARKHAGLKKITGFYWTDINKTYYTVAGINKKNNPIYVIIPKKGNQILSIKQNNGLSRNELLRRIWSYEKPKKVLQVAIGVFKKKATWNINYINQNGKLCYEIISFKTGKMLQNIQNI